jgi:Fic/DOC family protein
LHRHSRSRGPPSGERSFIGTCTRWRRRIFTISPWTHAFVDGNKRTALIACLTFLDLNGVRADRPEPGLFDLTMAVADGRVGKDAIAERLRSFFPPPGAERTP